MDFLIEATVEVVGEVISEGIDAVITSKKEKKRKKSQEEEADVHQELNH